MPCPRLPSSTTQETGARVNEQELQEYIRIRDAREARDRELREIMRAQHPVQVLPPHVRGIETRRRQPKKKRKGLVPPRRWEPGQYEAYVQSPEWESRKARYFQTHPRRCRICRREPRSGQLDLHHLSYDNLGNEPNSDLVALCQFHHSEVHEYHRRIGGSLREATLKAIALADTGTRISRRSKRRTVAANGRTQPR